MLCLLYYLFYLFSLPLIRLTYFYTFVASPQGCCLFNLCVSLYICIHLSIATMLFFFFSQKFFKFHLLSPLVFGKEIFQNRFPYCVHSVQTEATNHLLSLLPLLTPISLNFLFLSFGLLAILNRGYWKVY